MCTLAIFTMRNHLNFHEEGLLEAPIFASGMKMFGKILKSCNGMIEEFRFGMTRFNGIISLLLFSFPMKFLGWEEKKKN